jgi:MFS family permease
VARTADPRLWRVLVAASAGLFAIQLDFFAMQAALPDMARDLDTSIHSLQWVISGYMLSLASFFVAGGRLADIFGRRRCLLVGAVVFGLASLAGGAAPNAIVVIVMRIVQGAGGAILFTVSIAVVTNAFPAALVQRAVGLVFGFSALGEALGPVAGGFFTEVVSWRWVLWINVPVCLAIIVLVMTSVEESRDTTVTRVDWTGLALIVSAIGLFTFGVDQAPDWGWASPATLGLTGLATVLERFPSWAVMVVALLLGGLGAIGLGLAVHHPTAFFVLSVCGGFGLGLTFSFASVVTQSVVPPQQAGAASGVVMTVLVAVAGVAVAVAAAVSSSAIQQGPGAGLDDVITRILVSSGALAVLCTPFVWWLGRTRGVRPTARTVAGGRFSITHHD